MIRKILIIILLSFNSYAYHYSSYFYVHMNTDNSYEEHLVKIKKECAYRIGSGNRDDYDKIYFQYNNSSACSSGYLRCCWDSSHCGDVYVGVSGDPAYCYNIHQKDNSIPVLYIHQIQNGVSSKTAFIPVNESDIDYSIWEHEPINYVGENYYFDGGVSQIVPEDNTSYYYEFSNYDLTLTDVYNCEGSTLIPAGELIEQDYYTSRVESVAPCEDSVVYQPPATFDPNDNYTTYEADNFSDIDLDDLDDGNNDGVDTNDDNFQDSYLEDDNISSLVSGTVSNDNISYDVNLNIDLSQLSEHLRQIEKNQGIADEKLGKNNDLLEEFKNQNHEDLEKIYQALKGDNGSDNGSDNETYPGYDDSDLSSLPADLDSSGIDVLNFGNSLFKDKLILNTDSQNCHIQQDVHTSKLDFTIDVNFCDVSEGGYIPYSFLSSIIWLGAFFAAVKILAG